MSPKSKRPKPKWNVYEKVGALNRYSGSSYAVSEARAISNVWFAKHGRVPIEGKFFARRERDEAYHPPELYKSGEQLQFV